jgi:hypothetical protein
MLLCLHLHGGNQHQQVDGSRIPEDESVRASEACRWRLMRAPARDAASSQPSSGGKGAHNE